MNTPRFDRRALLFVALTLACTSSSPAPSSDVEFIDADPLVDVADELRSAPLGTGTEVFGNCTAAARRITDESCAGALECVPYYSRAGVAQFCSSRCDTAMMGADCPRAPSGSTATPSCIEADQGQSFCYLRCRADAECPSGMVCFERFICGWVR